MRVVNKNIHRYLFTVSITGTRLQTHSQTSLLHCVTYTIWITIIIIFHMNSALAVLNFQKPQKATVKYLPSNLTVKKVMLLLVLVNDLFYWFLIMVLFAATIKFQYCASLYIATLTLCKQRPQNKNSYVILKRLSW